MSIAFFAAAFVTALFVPFPAGWIPWGVFMALAIIAAMVED